MVLDCRTDCCRALYQEISVEAVVQACFMNVMLLLWLRTYLKGWGRN